MVNFCKKSHYKERPQFFTSCSFRSWLFRYILPVIFFVPKKPGAISALGHGEVMIELAMPTDPTLKMIWCLKVQFVFVNESFSGWWQLKYFFSFTPILGEMISILTNIFQMGWNHQPVLFVQWKKRTLGVFHVLFGFGVFFLIWDPSQPNMTIMTFVCLVSVGGVFTDSTIVISPWKTTLSGISSSFFSNHRTSKSKYI